MALVYGVPLILILNKAARYFLGVHRYSPNAVLHGDTGWLTDKYQRYLAILRFWNRLIGMPNDRVTKKIFNWDFDNDRNGWCGDVKTILSLLDMSDVYQNQQPCSLNLALSKLESIRQLQWKQTLDLKPKLRTYQTFKEDYATENISTFFLLCISAHSWHSLEQEFSHSELKLVVLIP